MRNYDLNIAGYKIRFESTAGGPELLPSERFHKFIVAEQDPDIIIKVHSGDFKIPSDAKMVFNAPYVEEINGLKLKKNDEFWSVYKLRDDIFIRTIFPHTGENRTAVLKFSLQKKEWDLWPGNEVNETDPMEYPLDGLILYYLTVASGDIMIHASGVQHSGLGYLFSGISGKGKSTMAKLWDAYGAKVIHDDRLVLRRKSDGFYMFNTPVYKNEKPAKSKLDRIFIIEHGPENKIVPVTGAQCISLIMANCIQHNWDHVIISSLLDSISAMSSSIPAAKLYFRPDSSIIELLLANE
ncbi:MAG: hypothetical protein V1903_02005 [Bacteroidota bacterium]